MLYDIETRSDIDVLLGAFYHKALADDRIGFLFTDVAKLDLDEHLPVIGDFWEQILFGTVNFQAKYRRSPMTAHRLLNMKSALTAEHFERWLKIFLETIDQLFTGPTASLAKLRALSIAETMRAHVTRDNVEGVRLTRE